MYNEPGGQWSAPMAPVQRGERPNLGLFVLVGGLAAVMFAMFALPIEDPIKNGNNQGLSQVFYSQMNQGASLSIDGIPGSARPFGALAKLWWQYLELVALGLIGVSVAIAAALPNARRLFGWITAVLTAATAAVYTFVLLQTYSILDFEQFFRRGKNAFEIADIGIWVSYGALGVLLLGGILTGLIRTSAVAAPIGAPPPQQYAGPPSGPQQTPYQQAPPPGWQQQAPQPPSYE